MFNQLFIGINATVCHFLMTSASREPAVFACVVQHMTMTMYTHHNPKANHKHTKHYCTHKQ